VPILRPQICAALCSHCDLEVPPNCEFIAVAGVHRQHRIITASCRNPTCTLFPAPFRLSEPSYSGNGRFITAGVPTQALGENIKLMGSKSVSSCEPCYAIVRSAVNHATREIGTRTSLHTDAMPAQLKRPITTFGKRIPRSRPSYLKFVE
jgi:hypothetical protein